MEKIDLKPFYRIETEIFVELSRFEQRRKHKRPRINKKWRKRYGFISENFRIPYSQFNPKYFKKYSKLFSVEGFATPKTSEIRFPVAEPIRITVKYEELPTSVSFEVKRIPLQKIGCRFATPYLFEISVISEEVIIALEKKIKEIESEIDLEYDILSAEILI